ncbi:MAG: 2OG-Fe(II) oxygenase, partial [Vicinamibacterales bacterium]
DATATADDLRLVREDEPMDPLPIGLVVAGDYRSGVTWHPAVVRGARAVLPLIDGTVLAREESATMLQTLARVGPEAVALMGPRPEATDVAPRLLELVDDAIVSRALAGGSASSGLASDLGRIAESRFQSRTVWRAPQDRQLCAARYVRMMDFLAADEHQLLLDHALACEEEFHESGIVGQRGENTLNYGIRRSRTLKPPRVEEIWSMFERRLRGIVPGVRTELEMPYFRLGKVERQLTAHGKGGFFAPHVDTGHPVAASRRISGVYYFHATPQRFSGGQLRLYDTWVTPTGSTGAGTYTTLPPVDNSLVFFPSAAFHEVCPVRGESDAFADSRFTVTIWFHEAPPPAEKPAGETLPAGPEGEAATTR